MRSILFVALTSSLVLAFTVQAAEKKKGKAVNVVTKDKRYIPSGEFLKFDIAPADR